MAGWHHRLNGHEFEETPGVGDGQGGLACCGSWGRKESDTTERLSELSPGENWDPDQGPGDTLQTQGCWWMGLQAEGRTDTPEQGEQVRREGPGQCFLVTHLLDLFL